MEANRVEEFQETLINPEFIEFCKSQDEPVPSFERVKLEMYRRSLGISKRPVPDTDRDVTLADLGFFNRGLDLLAG